MVAQQDYIWVLEAYCAAAAKVKRNKREASVAPLALAALASMKDGSFSGQTAEEQMEPLFRIRHIRNPHIDYYEIDEYLPKKYHYMEHRVWYLYPLLLDFPAEKKKQRLQDFIKFSQPSANYVCMGFLCLEEEQQRLDEIAHAKEILKRMINTQSLNKS